MTPLSLSCNTGVPKGEEREKEEKEIFSKVMAGNFSNLLKNISLYSHESQQTPLRISMESYRHHSKNADGQ